MGLGPGIVVWGEPSSGESGSMPIGNGDIGCNVWVEQDGDLCLYVAKSDAWCENGRLLKLGRIRIGLEPSPFSVGAHFRQSLSPQEGTVTIRSGGSGDELAIDIWVDAHAPVVRIEIAGDRPFVATVGLELWRTSPRQLFGQELHGAYGLALSPDPVIVDPDTIMEIPGERIVWHHRNERSIWESTLRLQSLADVVDGAGDPLLHRTSGGMICGDGMVRVDRSTLRSAAPSVRTVVSVHALTAQTASAHAWLELLEAQTASVRTTPVADARAANAEWWRAFSARSFIHVTGDADADIVTRGYALQRFIGACAGRGRFPIKFNGSLFSAGVTEVEGMGMDVPERLGHESSTQSLPKAVDHDPDYRRWGGPYWFQNTRLAYWHMLASGDFDLMEPLFAMYRDALALSVARTRRYFGHEGAFFPETIYFWGAYANDNYGWDRTSRALSDVDNVYIRRYWQGGLELVAMLLAHHAHTGDDGLLHSTTLPIARAVTAFYDEHYRRDDRGSLVLEPAQALETWQDVVNPLPDIAGLMTVLDGLLALRLDDGEWPARWARLRCELPPLPTTVAADGGELLAAAGDIRGPRMNLENPELYALFPYRLFGVGMPDLDVACRAYDNRHVRETGGWHQSAIHAAIIGEAGEARALVVENFSTFHKGSRFPAFWGPNYDWVPDQDHGGVAMIALQSMLLQVDGDRILIFPAWPDGWDVDFLLHAPGRTTVEASLRGGEVTKLVVHPESRAADVVLCLPPMSGDG